MTFNGGSHSSGFKVKALALGGWGQEWQSLHQAALGMVWAID